MILEHIIANIKHIGIFSIFLSILIIVHEWGHFITARKLGIGVEKFSLGFGPKLFSKMHKGTEFLVCLIPLGGYVKMKGDERSDCKGTADEFYSKSPGKRALVIFNGAFVNYILAYFCLVVVFMIGYPGGSTTIAKIEQGGPASEAGIRTGDQIVGINSKKVYGTISLESMLEDLANPDLQVKVLRNGKQLSFNVKADVTEKEDLLGAETTALDLGASFLSNEIGFVFEGYPAEEAGLKIGDKITRINGSPIQDWEDIQNAISSSPEGSLTIVFLRDGKEFEKQIEPKIEKEASEDENLKKMLGIGPSQKIELYDFHFGESFFYGMKELLCISGMTYKSIYRMLTGRMSAKKVSGPVGIFYIVTGAAEEGFVHLLFVLGIISASLAIFNLLPIMPLDGGHLFLLVIEKIRKKPFSPKVDEIIARIGFAMILTLAVFVFYNDFDKMGIITKITASIKGLF